MRTLQISRTAVAGSLMLGCCVGIYFPAIAAPADVRIVTSAPDKSNDPVKSSESATGAGSQFELSYWQSVSGSNDADQLQAYLARYPNGTFSELARVKIAALNRHSGAAAGTGAADAGAGGAGEAVMKTATPAAAVAAPVVAAAVVTKAPKAVPPAEADDGDLVGPSAAIPGADVAIAKVPVPAAQSPKVAKSVAASTVPAKPAPIVAAKVVKLAPVPVEPAEKAPEATSTAGAASTVMVADSSVSPSLAQQLRALGQSQGRRPEPVAVQQSEPPVLRQSEPPAPRQLIAIPSRPKLASVPKVSLPDHFCTAMERHDFYNSVYQPARSIADQNERTATGHMLKLQSIHDDYAQRQDQAATDAIAVEVRDYETLASDAHHDSAAFEDLFNGLMAVPIRQCGESA